MDHYRLPATESAESSRRPYYRDRQPDARTSKEKRREYMREKSKANSTGRSPRRLSNQATPTQVWRVEPVNSLDNDLPDCTTVVPTNTAGPSMFSNYTPENICNLLGELRKNRYRVDSWIPPSSSRGVVEQNIDAYKNYFSTTNQVVVSLTYPVSLLEERFSLLEPRDPESLTYDPIGDLVSIVKELYSALKSNVDTGLLQSWLDAVEERDLNKFNRTFADINELFRCAH